MEHFAQYLKKSKKGYPVVFLKCNFEMAYGFLRDWQWVFYSFWSIFYRKITLYHFLVEIWILVHYSTPLSLTLSYYTKQLSCTALLPHWHTVVPYAITLQLMNNVTVTLSQSDTLTNSPFWEGHTDRPHRGSPLSRSPVRRTQEENIIQLCH